MRYVWPTPYSLLAYYDLYTFHAFRWLFFFFVQTNAVRNHLATWCTITFRAHQGGGVNTISRSTARTVVTTTPRHGEYCGYFHSVPNERQFAYSVCTSGPIPDVTLRCKKGRLAGIGFHLLLPRFFRLHDIIRVSFHSVVLQHVCSGWTQFEGRTHIIIRGLWCK